MAGSEMAPLARTGGLGDVLGTLPAELLALGHEVSVVLPYYRSIRENRSLKIKNTGTQLSAGGSYKIIARAATGNAGLVAGPVPASVTVGGNGAANAASLQITGGELYLNVAPNLPGTGTNLTFSVTGDQLNLNTAQRDGPANRSQPVQPGTNSTQLPAGSGR